MLLHRRPPMGKRQIQGPGRGLEDLAPSMLENVVCFETMLG